MTSPVVSEPKTTSDRSSLADVRDGAEGTETALHTWLSAHGAVETCHQFQRLLTEVFPPETAFTFTPESDPDSEDDSVVCLATLPPRHSADALAYYNRFAAQWARHSDSRLSGLFTLLVRSSGNDRP